jgi:hypothetical protein
LTSQKFKYKFINAAKDLPYANTKTGQKMKGVLVTTTAYKFMNATEDLPCATTNAERNT